MEREEQRGKQQQQRVVRAGAQFAKAGLGGPMHLCVHVFLTCADGCGRMKRRSMYFWRIQASRDLRSAIGLWMSLKKMEKMVKK